MRGHGRILNMCIIYDVPTQLLTVYPEPFCVPASALVPGPRTRVDLTEVINETLPEDDTLQVSPS